jgi:hypothetical protein
VLSRLPNQEEAEVSLEFLNQQREIFQNATADQSAQQPAQQASQELLAVANQPVHRARQNLAVSLFSHNDFVTIR